MCNMLNVYACINFHCAFSCVVQHHRQLLLYKQLQTFKTLVSFISQEQAVGMDSSDDSQLDTLDDSGISAGQERSATSNDLQRKRAIAVDKKRRSFDKISHASSFGGLGQQHTGNSRKGSGFSRGRFSLATGIDALGRRLTGFKKRSFDTTRRRSLLEGLQKRAFGRAAAAKRQRQRRREA